MQARALQPCRHLQCLNCNWLYPICCRFPVSWDTYASLSDLHDVQHRITSAGAMFSCLKSTLCACKVNLTLKSKIYRTLVVSILLYRPGAWVLMAETCRVLASFRGRCVRRTQRITLQHTQKHRISAATLEGKLGISKITGTINDPCLHWAGHVAWVDKARLPWRFLTSWVLAKRRCGRPHNSTLHCTQRAGSSWLKNGGLGKMWYTGWQSKSALMGQRRGAQGASATAPPTGSMSATRTAALQHGMHTACQHIQGSCLY